MSIIIEVLGMPLVQQRHKQWSKNGVTGQVDPSAEAKRDFLLKVQQHAPPQPWDCPIRVELTLVFPWPASQYRNDGSLKPTAPFWYCPKKRHDVDNLLKFVMDALSGVFFVDDGLIAEAKIAKHYGLRASTWLEISKLEQAQP